MRRFTVATILVSILAAMPVGSVSADDPVSTPRPVVTSDGAVLPPLPAELEQPSAHAEMLAEHADDVIAFEPGARPALTLDEGLAMQRAAANRLAGADVLAGGAAGATSDLQAAGRRLPNGLRKEVFGFLPYWMLTDSALDSMNYQLVSSIAYFSVNAGRNGGLVKGTSDNPSTGWSGWKSAAMTEVIERAHQQGVRVVLTVTMMSWDSASADRQAALLGSSTARARLATEIVSALRDRGADGVNLDFEPLATSLRDEYVSFVKQLKRRLVNAGVGDYLTVCVMAGSATWATGYDVAGLTSDGAADALFVMGYDYNWSGSSRAGGVAPVQSPYTIDVAGTMADFLTQTSGSKLLWGVPYYGRTWPTETKTLNSRTLGHGSKSYTYVGHLSHVAQYGRRWDDVGKVPWYRYWDGAAHNWVQGYYDDVTSLGAKYDLVNAHGLAGTGMWTLLMDQGRDELWRLLARKFVTDTAAPVGGIRLLPPTSDAQAIRVRWRASDFISGIASYSVQWRRPGGAWHALASGTTLTSTWFTGAAGRTYQFRFRATDNRGNTSAWSPVAPLAASLEASSFASVAAPTLNVRSGPGTEYGIIDSALEGDVVYVMEGPKAADGYQWYRVEYGFTEFPSAEYPKVAWMAGSGSSGPMLQPAPAPSSTSLEPFVTMGDRTELISPNGDGTLDSASVAFDLARPASAVRLDILDTSAAVVRSISVGSRPSGSNTITWDGRLGSGDPAPDGSYLARITATDAQGDSHAGPSGSFNRAALRRWGINVDGTAPAVQATPAAGTEMVPVNQAVGVMFSEPVRGASTSSVTLHDGTASLPATVTVAADGRSLTIEPERLLPAGRALSVRLDEAVRDAAGNRPATTAWSFWTAPGSGYRPPRDGKLSGGTRSGYDIAQDGDLLRRYRADLPSSRQVDFGQRAALPNLPGWWLRADSGPLAGRWLREGSRQHLNGYAARQRFGAEQHLRLQAGTLIGYRFRSNGSVRGSRSVQMASRGWADASQRAVINGTTYWRLVSGPLDGFWVAESSQLYRRGKLGAMSFGAPPRVDVSAGHRTAFAYDALGRVVDAVTLRLAHATAIRVSGWAVINGVPHFLVSSGEWAGLWLPESDATRLHV